jgi:hypothetical protein
MLLSTSCFFFACSVFLKAEKYELQETAAALRTAANDSKRVADAARAELAAAFALEESQVYYNALFLEKI